MTPFNRMHTTRFMWSHPAHLFALGFGSGLSPLAPGTVGTLWAWASYSLLNLYLNTAEMGVLIGASLVLGWWFCTVTAEHMHMSDPSAIVWDEIAAFWLVLWLWMPASFAGQLVAFVLFRLFDALKPEPMAWADRHFKGFGPRGGFGIMLDDLLAAFCTLLVLALWKAWW
jgi:phosphatidylglycerophosphatase A